MANFANLKYKKDSDQFSQLNKIYDDVDKKIKGPPKMVKGDIFQELKLILYNTEVDSFEDRALGCMLGAFCGDACGSFLEFTYYNSEQDMDECMLMPGGGPFMLGSG